MRAAYTIKNSQAEQLFGLPLRRQIPAKILLTEQHKAEKLDADLTEAESPRRPACMSLVTHVDVQARYVGFDYRQ